MDTSQLSPVAEMLIASYFDTAQYSRDFKEDRTGPPTSMAKAHHLRAVMQDLLIKSDGYELASEYVECGRVEFRDRLYERSYLLRSKGAVAIDQECRQREQLFSSAGYIDANVTLLIYEFGPDELSLWVVGGHQTRSSRRIVPTGTPVFVDSWPYASEPGPHGTFQQDVDDDPFGEVGDVGESDAA